jgi:hypothetical protein
VGYLWAKVDEMNYLADLAGMGMGMWIRERPCQALVGRSESNGPMDGGQMIFALVNVPRNDAIRSGSRKTGAFL